MLKNEARMLQDGRSRHNCRNSEPLGPGISLTLNPEHTIVLNFALFWKKKRGGVATLKPPKEDGGFLCVQFLSVHLEPDLATRIDKL